MSEHEEYVRCRWERVLDDSGWVRIEGVRSAAWTGSSEKRWAAAYAFTLEREEEIRQIEREMEWLQQIIDFDWFVDEARRPKDWSGKCFGDIARITYTIARILRREQAALSGLKKGLRSEAGKKSHKESRDDE